MSEFLPRSHVRFLTMVCRRHVSPARSMTKLGKPPCKPIYRRKKKVICLLEVGPYSKNCGLGLVNAALSLRPRSGSIFKTSVGRNFWLCGPPNRQIILIPWNLAPKLTSMAPKLNRKGICQRRKNNILIRKSDFSTISCILRSWRIPVIDIQNQKYMKGWKIRMQP